MQKKQYYLSNLEQPPNQLVETPASKERTDKRRFIITTVICIVSAVAAIISAIASIFALILA